MQIQAQLNPDIKLTREVLYFELMVFNLSQEELSVEFDKYGSTPVGYIIARDNKKLIGAINLYYREVNFMNYKINLGGIGYVSVIENYRRQSIATKMLEMALPILKNQGCDICLLNLDHEYLSKLYRSFGFAPLGREYISKTPSGETLIHKSGMIAPLNSQKIFEVLLNSKNILDLDGQSW